MSEIVSIRGEPLPEPRAPNPALVELARVFLALAESGELQGAIISGLYWDDATYGMRAGRLNYSVIGRLEDLKLRTLDDLS